MPHLFETLGLTRAPRVEDLLERQGVKLFDLMVVALIERDGPMPVAEIAARLGSAGVDSSVPRRAGRRGCEPWRRAVDAASHARR